jgi:polyhydroxybutyrate depolymerase
MLLKILNGGHTWPGSAGVTGIGITNRDIVASSEIWNFVKQFSRPGTGVGISEIPQSDFKVFPNPLIDGKLHITLPESVRSGIINISDLSGRLVYSEQITKADKNLTLNMPQLKPGYYLIIVAGNSYSYKHKLVVH